ncbi:MAG: hypothetical protein Q7T28_13375 [Cypionkella sp.]|nr:hypothetical protein [Cypionkella sp.]
MTEFESPKSFSDRQSKRRATFPSKRVVSVIRRGNTWYLKRNVPKKFDAIEVRKVIWKALSARSEKSAQIEAASVWGHMVWGWERALLTGAFTELQVANVQANRLGCRYLPTSDVAKLPLDKLLERIEASVDGDGKINAELASVLLGGAGRSPRISNLYADFVKIAAQDNPRMSSAQHQKLRQRYDFVIRKLTEAIGDVDPSTLTRIEIFELKNRWLSEVPQISTSTINNRFCTLHHIFDRLRPVREFTLKFEFKEFLIRRPKTKTRPSFSTNWIKSKLLSAGALGGLDTQTRCILLGMINTGLRLSECANLLPNEINLSGATPHLHLQGAFRPLKTHAAYRVIPLLGASLEAFQSSPNGFPDYRDLASLSAKLNTYLTKSGLRETPKHTVYGLRHAFEDRLFDAGVSETMKAVLMGHKSYRPVYGRGPTLEQRAEILKLIAL